MIPCCLYHLFCLKYLLCTANCFFHVHRRSKKAGNEIEKCHLEKIGQTLPSYPHGEALPVWNYYSSGLSHEGMRIWLVSIQIAIIGYWWRYFGASNRKLIINRELIGMIVVSSQIWQNSWTAQLGVKRDRTQWNHMILQPTLMALLTGHCHPTIPLCAFYFGNFAQYSSDQDRATWLCLAQVMDSPTP